MERSRSTSCDVGCESKQSAAQIEAQQLTLARHRREKTDRVSSNQMSAMEHGSHLMKLVAACIPASSAGNRRLPSATSATVIAKQNECRFHRVCVRRPRYTRNDGDCNYLVQYAFGQEVR